MFNRLELRKLFSYQSCLRGITFILNYRYQCKKTSIVHAPWRMYCKSVIPFVSTAGSSFKTAVPISVHRFEKACYRYCRKLKIYRFSQLGQMSLMLIVHCSGPLLFLLLLVEIIGIWILFGKGSRDRYRF